MEHLIESAWRNCLARESGKGLFPGPLCRLLDYSAAEDTLKLELGPTDYRELIGTNVCHPEIAERFGHDYLSNALAVHAVVATVDRRLLVFKRSSDVGEYPEAYDVCGGHIDPEIDAVRSVPSPYKALRRELREEIGLADDETERIVCCGLVRNTATLKPDLIFDVWTKLTWSEFEHRDLNEEHRSVHCIPDSTTGIVRFLADHIENMAPAGVAALELHDVSCGDRGK